MDRPGWRNSLSLTFSPAGNVYVRRKVTSGPCDSYSASAFIIVQPTVSNNVVRQDQSICINTIAAALTGSDATGGNGTYTYQWQQSADGGNTWTTIAGATARDYNPGILTTTTSYRRIASSNLCAGAQSNISPIVTVTIHPDAKALFLPPKDTACAHFHITDADINLQTFADRNSIYEWYADGAQIGRGVSFPGNVITNSEDSVTIKLVTVSKYGCKNDSMEHKFYTFIAPQPAFEASDTVGCGPLTVGFTNLTPKARLFIYHWDFGNGQTSALADPASVIFQPNPTYLDTTYKVKLTVFTQCDTITVFKNIHVKSKPKVLFTPDKTEGCSPMRVTFTNTSRGNNANYIWDFGDGTSPVVTNDATIQHTFTVGVRDTFYVKLKGTNECGADSLIYAIVVNPNSIRIDFAINGNERFWMRAAYSSFYKQHNRGDDFLNWNFGDGSTLNTSKGIDTVVHTYTSPGNDTIKLFASNACNDTSDTELVTVALKPKVSFTANPLTACITETIHFANTSNSDIVSVWNFGDATTSSLRDPDKAYTSGGNYKVWLTGSRIYPEGTCRDSTYADVVIRDTIPGSFAVSDSAGNCTPFTVTFKNLNSPSRQTAWTFGDGATASGDSVTHTYTATGVYNVVMISHGSSGCIFKSVKSVSVTAPFGILIYKGGFFCKNQPIKFEIQATNTAEYKFVFGDGDSLTTTNPVVYHKYSQGGPFLPYAYLISGNCIKKIATGDTIKNENIKAGFSIIPNYNCGTTDIQFTDTSYAYSGLKLWQWNFGDGTSSSLQNPVKTFTQSGTSYVRFSISGQSGCRDTVTVPVSVIIRNIPVSNIRADSVACTSEALPVSALVFSQDSVVRYSWNFGDNATASGSHTIAVYNNTGTYTIRLTTTTIYGCSDTVYNKIIVNATPIVNAGGYVRICKGQSVQLQAFGAARWQWTPLQNLSCNTCANPVANPSLSTTYIVKGTTTFGCSATDTIAVNVVPPAKITISGDDTICIGQQTQLFASGAVDYAWSPAAGLSSASVANPVAKPATTTQYQVIGSDPYNCFADTAYVTVAVGNYPTVNLGTGGLVVAGTQVKMNPLFTNGPFLNYTWTPIDNLSCSSCPQPVATINTNVVYRLEVENVYGCKASDTISYTVKCEEAAQMFVPNAFSPDNDGLNDVLMVRGKGLAAVKYFRIFNRWGQLVFERNNFNANDVSQGWDGKVNGKPANPDVYVYTAEVICTAGGVFVKKGNVTLFR